MRNPWARLAACALVGACHCAPAEGPDFDARGADRPDLEANAAPLLASSRTLLDEQGPHRLEGELLPAPPDSDAQPVYRLLLDGREAGQVRDARFVPGDPERLLSVDPLGVLSIVDRGASVTITDEVQLGFDVSDACRCAVFVRGDDGAGVLMRLGLDDRRLSVVSDDVAPVWLPAISPRGDAVAFASGRDGDAALWRHTMEGGPIERVTRARQPFPEGPAPLLWVEGGLLFAGPQAVHHVGFDGQIRSQTGLGAPRWVRRPRTVRLGTGPEIEVDRAVAGLGR